MSCNTVQSKLSAYLDGEMSGVEMQAIRSHVSHCSVCNTELNKLKTVQMILRGLPASPEPPVDLPAKISMGVSTLKRSYVRMAVLCSVPVLAFAFFAYPRPKPTFVPDRNLVIYRQVAKDQIFDAGSDSPSGASLVHFASYQGH